MVFVLAVLHPNPDKKDELKEGLKKVAAQVEASEPDCHFYRVFEHEDGEIIILEKFKDQAALEAHQKQPYQLEAMEKSKAEGALIKEPMIKVFKDEHFAGFGPRG